MMSCSPAGKERFCLFVLGGFSSTEVIEASEVFKSYKLHLWILKQYDLQASALSLYSCLEFLKLWVETLQGFDQTLTPHDLHIQPTKDWILQFSVFLLTSSLTSFLLGISLSEICSWKPLWCQMTSTNCCMCYFPGVDCHLNCMFDECRSK